MEAEKKRKTKDETKKGETKPISINKTNLLPGLDISFDKRLQDRLSNKFSTEKQVYDRKNRALVMRILQETYEQYKAVYVNRLKKIEGGSK